MLPQILSIQAIIIVLFGTRHGAAQLPSIIPMFILDSAPLSLDASLVAVNAVPTRTSDVVMTFSLSCPTAASPDNDACRAQSIYPAEVWHTQGSVWGGTATARADDSTTAWVCDLGSCGSCSSQTGGPHCIKSITLAGGASTRVETTQLNSCYIIAHTVPLLVTAGADKLNKVWYQTLDVSALQSIYSSELSSMGCPRVAATTTAATSTTTGAGSKGTGASSTATGAASTTPIGSEVSSSHGVQTTGPSSTGSQAVNTLVSSTSPSSTVASGSSSRFRDVPWLGAVGTLVICLVI